MNRTRGLFPARRGWGWGTKQELRLSKEAPALNRAAGCVEGS